MGLGEAFHESQQQTSLLIPSPPSTAGQPLLYDEYPEYQPTTLPPSNSNLLNSLAEAASQVGKKSRQGRNAPRSVAPFKIVLEESQGNRINY